VEVAVITPTAPREAFEHDCNPEPQDPRSHPRACSGGSEDVLAPETWRPEADRPRAAVAAAPSPPPGVRRPRRPRPLSLAVHTLSGQPGRPRPSRLMTDGPGRDVALHAVPHGWSLEILLESRAYHQARPRNPDGNPSVALPLDVVHPRDARGIQGPLTDPAGA
jgi:hypothetical protein